MREDELRYLLSIALRRGKDLTRDIINLQHTIDTTSMSNEKFIDYTNTIGKIVTEFEYLDEICNTLRNEIIAKQSNEVCV